MYETVQGFVSVSKGQRRFPIIKRCQYGLYSGQVK
jgi:hypothetical protein